MKTKRPQSREYRGSYDAPAVGRVQARQLHSCYHGKAPKSDSEGEHVRTKKKRCR